MFALQKQIDGTWQNLHSFTAHEGTAQMRAGLPVASSPQAGIRTPPLDLKHTAIAHYQSGRLQEATQAFQLLRQQHPEDYLVLQYLIELYWRQGDQNQALMGGRDLYML